MRILFLCFLYICVSSQLSFGQNDTSKLKIRVIDSSTNEPLIEATVLISSGIKKQNQEITTNESGYCEIFIRNHCDVNLIVSFEDYYSKNITIKDIVRNKLIIVPLRKEPLELASVVIKSPPLYLKGDTIEYKASQYYNGKNTTLADVLRRIPGILIGKDGTITAFGKIITTIRINGVDLLLSDPTILSQNLPADIVDKIQLIDDKSSTSQLTGFDDGNHQEIINVTLNKKKMNSYIGNLSGGYTNDDRYSVYARLFRFQNNEQIVSLVTANNINGRFSTDATSTGPAENNNKSISVGTGYNFSPHLKATFGITTTETTSTIEKQDIRSYNLDTIYTDKQSNQNQNHSNSYELNGSLQYGVSKTDSLLFQAKLIYLNSSNVNLDSFWFYNQSNVISNNGIQAMNSHSSAPNLSISMAWVHRFRPKGMILVETAGVEINSNKTYTNTFTTNKTLSNEQTDTTWLSSNTNLNGKSYYSNTNYIASLTAASKMELSYSINYSYNFQNNLVYTITPYSQIFNDSLSSSQYVPSLTQNLSFQYKYESKKVSTQLGITVGPSLLTNKTTSIDSPEKVYLNELLYSPYVTISYAIDKRHRIQIDYSGVPQLPSASQLQSIANYNNPLNIQQGNPNLKESYANTVHISYHSTTQVTGSSFIENLSLTSNSHEISTNTIIMQNGAQIIEPININGNYIVSNNISYNQPLLKNRLNAILIGSMNYSHTVGETRGLKNIGNIWSITPTAMINYTPYSYLRISLLSNVNKNTSSYNLSNISSDITNFDFAQHTEIDFKNGLLVKTNVEYKYENGVPTEVDKKPILINIQLEKSIINEKLNVAIGVNDLLNQNIGYIYQAGQGYTENEIENYLTRYYILEILWKFQYHKPTH
jgi:hypothetical protein